MAYKVRPVQPSGVRDYGAQEAIPRIRMMVAIRKIYERYGFDPLVTPAFERRDVLGAETEGSKLIYSALKARSEIDSWDSPGLTMLRFDHTVPLARYVAANWNKLPHPFKRYAWGDVFRGEHAQANRLREFFQYDCDTVGVDSMEADIEIVGVMHDVLSFLGLKDSVIHINNRKVLNALSILADFDPKLSNDVLMTLDKSDKIGADGVRTELSAKVGLTVGQIDQIVRFQELTKEGAESPIEEARALFDGIMVAQQGLDELDEILSGLRSLSIDSSRVQINFGVARGLGYYTGPVFEARIPDYPASIMGGGRYDGLINRYSSMNLPAVGASIGVDRVFEALAARGLLHRGKTVVDFGIVSHNDVPRDYRYQIATRLRAIGAKVELIPMGKTVGQQLKALEARGIHMAILATPDHMQNSTYRLIDFRRKQLEAEYQAKVTAGVATPSVLESQGERDFPLRNLEIDAQEALNYQSFMNNSSK